VTPSRGDTRMKKIVAEFRKNTGQTTSEGGSRDETTAEKGHHFAEGDSPNIPSVEHRTSNIERSSFFRKKGDTVELPPRVTPTLMTSLHIRTTKMGQSTNVTFAQLYTDGIHRGLRQVSRLLSVNFLS